MIWCDDSCGYFARTRAATPETIAVEKLVPAGTSSELSGPSIALVRLSSRGERPTTSVPGAAIDTHGPATLNLSIGAPEASTAPTVRTKSLNQDGVTTVVTPFQSRESLGCNGSSIGFSLQSR